MVTRSIVGRFLILAVLLVSLGVIAQAAMIITKDSGRKAVAKADAAAPAATMPTVVASAAPAPAAVTMANAAPAAPAAPPTPAVSVLASAMAAPVPAVATLPGPSADAAPVRVVYPGPLGEAPVQPRKFAEAAPASPIPAPETAPAPQIAPAPQPVAAAQPAPAPVQVASADAGTQPKADTPPAGKGIDLNRASAEALNHIGGGHIGQSIVQHRPYRSVEDLVKKRVVRRSVYEQIKSQVAAE